MEIEYRPVINEIKEPKHFSRCSKLFQWEDLLIDDATHLSASKWWPIEISSIGKEIQFHWESGK